MKNFLESKRQFNFKERNIITTNVIFIHNKNSEGRYRIKTKQKNNNLSNLYSLIKSKFILN